MDIKSKYIVVEGIDGSGKSTLSANIKNALLENNLATESGFEPTKTTIGLELRSLLEDTEHKTAVQDLARLSCCDRYVHLNHPLRGVKSFLKNGQNYVSDRCWVSAMAYQGLEMSLDEIFEMNKPMILSPKIDLLIYLNVPIDVALERIKLRDETISVFEKEEVLNRLIDIYHKIKEVYVPSVNIEVLEIDSRLTQDEILKIAMEKIASL